MMNLTAFALENALPLKLQLKFEVKAPFPPPFNFRVFQLTRMINRLITLFLCPQILSRPMTKSSFLTMGANLIEQEDKRRNNCKLCGLLEEGHGDDHSTTTLIIQLGVSHIKTRSSINKI